MSAERDASGRDVRPGFAGLVCSWICTLPAALLSMQFIERISGVSLPEDWTGPVSCAIAFAYAAWAGRSRAAARWAGYMGLIGAPMVLIAAILMPVYLQDRPKLWYVLPPLIACSAVGCIQLGFRSRRTVVAVKRGL